MTVASVADLMTFRRLVVSLSRYSFRHGDEIQLHRAIAEVLKGEGFAFEREVVGSPSDRFDFLVEPRIVIEAKVDKSLPDALRQIDRYAALPGVDAVVLVTTRLWGVSDAFPSSLRGKPVAMVKLKGQAF